MDADEIVGKTVLVGLTYLEADGSVREQQQWHGVIVTFDPEDGVGVRRPTGEVETLPPNLEEAEPGEYTLRGTGEVVSNPDFVSTWTISAPGEGIDSDEDERGIYVTFTHSLESLLDTLLDEADIDYGYVVSFSRTPNVSYDLNRAEGDGPEFDHLLASSLRVAGVSVIVEAPGSMPSIADLVQREFVVDAARSLSIEEAAARNGRLVEPGASNGLTYEYPYYLVSLDERRLELDEWSPFAGLKVWIELRTVLQTAWQDIIEDALPFRSAASYPSEVRALLARSALGLSTIDADLAEAKHVLDRLLAEYEEAVATEDLALPVNAVSAAAYMGTSALVRSLVELAEDVGLTSYDDYELETSNVEHLTSLLRSAGVHTLAELDAFLKQALPRARDLLAELGRIATDRGSTPWAQPDSIVEWLWLLVRRADADTIAILRYNDELEYALNTLIGNPVPAGEPEET